MGIFTFYHNGKRFIRDIQRSDAPRRKKWFIGGSVVSMCIVLLLWVVYLSIEVPTITPPENPTQKTEEIKNTDTESIFNIFGRGITNITDDFKKRFNEFKGAIEKNFTSMKGAVKEKNTTYIQGARLNFVLDDLEPIPPTHLP